MPSDTIKTMNLSDLAKHKQDAVVIFTGEEIPADVLSELDQRYGVSEDGSLIEAWRVYLNSLPDWKPGKITKMNLGANEDQPVIFCCVSDPNGAAQYPYIRDCFRKMATNANTLEVRSVACIFPECGGGDTRDVLMGVVVDAAVGASLNVVIYDKITQ